MEYLKKIYTLTKTGEFRQALMILKKNNGKKFTLSRDKVAYIAIYCYMPCVNKKIKEDVDTNDLTELLLYCLQYLDGLNDNELLQYLQGIHFVLKFLIDKEDYEAIVNLQDCLIPSFVTNIETIGQQNAFNSSCCLLDSAIRKIYHHNKETVNTKTYSSLISLAILMYKVQTPLKKVYDENIYTYLYCLINTPSVAKGDMTKKFEEVLYFLEFVDNEEVIMIVPAVLKILKIFLSQFLKNSLYNESIDLMNKTVSLLSKKTQPTPKVIKALDSINTLLKGIIHHPRTDPKFASSLLQCYKDIKSEFESNNFSESVREICSIVYNILRYMSTAFIKFGENTVGFAQPEVQLNLYKLLGIVARLISQNPYTCSCNDDCQLNKDLITAINTSALVPYYTRIILSGKGQCTSFMLKMVVKHCEQTCLFIKSVREANCNRWRAGWETTGSMIYSIGTGLYNESNENCIQFYKLFVQKLIEFEGPEGSLIHKGILNNALSQLSEWNLKQQNYEYSLFLAAFNVFVSDSNRHAGYQNWTRVKCITKEARSEDVTFQKETVISVLERNASGIKEFWPNACRNKELDADLLVGELRFYKKTWPSKISMLSTLKHFLAITTDTLSVVKVIIDIWIKNDLAIDNDLCKVVGEVLEEYNQKLDKKEIALTFETHVYLACLNFVYFNHLTMVLRSKSLKIVEDIEAVNKQKIQDLTDDDAMSNVNDECDIVTMYEHLRHDTHFQIMKHLNEAFLQFDSCLSGKETQDNNNLELLKQLGVYDILVRISQEYRLHCCSLEYLNTRFLCLKLAKLLGDHYLFVESAGFVLENSKPTSNEIENIIDEVEVVIKKWMAELEGLNEEEQSRRILILINYYLCKAVHFYELSKIEEGYKTLEFGFKYLENLPEAYQDGLLKIRLEHLKCLYLMLPCKYKVPEHDSDSLGKPHHLLKSIIGYIKTKAQNSPFALSTLFDIMFSIIDRFRWLRFPREMRCYCKQMAVVSQQMGIPLRAAHALYYLAQADAFSTKLDDCQMKIDGMSYILNLSSKSVQENKAPIKNNPKKDVSTKTKVNKNNKKEVQRNEDNFEDIIDSFHKMSIAVPEVTKKHRTTVASPTFQTAAFTLPHFLTHKNDCICIKCMSVDFQKLIFSKLLLEIQLNTLQNEEEVAGNILVGAMKIYLMLKFKEEEFRKKVENNMNSDVLKNMDEFICDVFGPILIEYGNYFLRNGQKESACKVNKQLMHLLQGMTCKNAYLLVEALEQKTNVMWALNEEEIRKVEDSIKFNKIITKDKNKDRMPGDTLVVPNISYELNNLDKTPENKESKVTVDDVAYPDVRPSKKKLLKPTRVDFSDNEESVVKVPSPLKRTELMLLKPATVSKIKIYTGGEEKPGRKKKTNATAQSDECVGADNKISSRGKGLLNGNILASSKESTNDLLNDKDLPNAKDFSNAKNLPYGTDLPKSKTLLKTSSISNIKKYPATKHNLKTTKTAKSENTKENFTIPLDDDIPDKAAQKRKVESGLKSRTKLLTEKLKNSTVKNPSKVDEDEEVIKLKRLVRRPVCRKLTSEVSSQITVGVSSSSSSSSSSISGAVRKSARTVKK